MFSVARNALLSIELRQAIRVRGIIEFAGRVRIFFGLQFRTVTVDTGVLLHTHELRVTGVTRKFDLIVTVRCFAGE